MSDYEMTRTFSENTPERETLGTHSNYIPKEGKQLANLLVLLASTIKPKSKTLETFVANDVVPRLAYLCQRDNYSNKKETREIDPIKDITAKLQQVLEASDVRQTLAKVVLSDLKDYHAMSGFDALIAMVAKSGGMDKDAIKDLVQTEGTWRKTDAHVKTLLAFTQFQTDKDIVTEVKEMSFNAVIKRLSKTNFAGFKDTQKQSRVTKWGMTQLYLGCLYSTATIDWKVVKAQLPGLFEPQGLMHAARVGWGSFLKNGLQVSNLDEGTKKQLVIEALTGGWLQSIDVLEEYGITPTHGQLQTASALSNTEKSTPQENLRRQKLLLELAKRVFAVKDQNELTAMEAELDLL